MGSDKVGYGSVELVSSLREVSTRTKEKEFKL